MGKSGWYIVDGKPIHLFGRDIGSEALEQVRQLIAEMERMEKVAQMAPYRAGDEVQFRQQVIRANSDRVFNIGEKALITAIALDGTYTVRMQADEMFVSEITDDDIEASAE